MVDIVDAATRSRMMSGIRGKNTRPEIQVRSMLHKAGFRYRLHVKALPGKPDIVLPKFCAVIFVHGCFWHGHDCHLFKWPKTRDDFWRKKIARNKEIDIQSTAMLRTAGWRCGVVWECALRGRCRVRPEEISIRLSRWLRSDREAMQLSSKKFRKSLENKR